MNKVIRALGIEDLGQLSEFFCRLSPYDRSMKFISWFYLLQTDEFFTYGAFIDQKLVGAVSVVRKELRHREIAIPCGLSVHALIDPDMKDCVSIFELTKPLYRLCAEKGMKIILGFPNRNFYFIQEKIDKFKEITKFNALVLSTQKVTEKNEGMSFELLVEDFEIISELSFALKHLGKRGIHFHRTVNDYYTRTVSNPEAEYNFSRVRFKSEYSGLVVTKCYEKNGVRSLHLIDYYVKDEVAVPGLMKALVWELKSRCDQFVFWPLDGLMKKVLLDLGFEETGFETYFGCKNLGLSEEVFNEISNKYKWQMAMIDSDVF